MDRTATTAAPWWWWCSPSQRVLDVVRTGRGVAVLLPEIPTDRLRCRCSLDKLAAAPLLRRP